jgi:hypothetical protein
MDSSRKIQKLVTACISSHLPKYLEILTTNTGQVTFSAQTSKGPYKFTVQVNEASNVPGDFIPRLAARSMIRDLQDNRSYLHKPDGLKKGVKESDLKKEIIELSIRYLVFL